MKNLLLVESHAPTLEHLQKVLSLAGYAVRAVREAGAALEAFVSTHPEVVVLAVDLPPLEGGHLAQVLRRNIQGKRVPLIAIDKGHLGRARGLSSVLNLGVNAYVENPLAPDVLVAKVESLRASAPSRESSQGTRAVLARPPVLAGELADSPLPNVVVSLYRSQRDGVLVVQQKEVNRRIFLLGGVSVSADSSEPHESLLTFLRRRRLLSEEQEKEVCEALDSGLRIFAALAEAGVDAVGEGLEQLLRDYTRERLTHLISLRDGHYAFHSGDEFQREVAKVEIPALASVLEGARRTFSLQTMAAPLLPHLAQYPLRTPDFARDLAMLALDTEDLKVAMQVTGRLPLKELLVHGRGDLRRGTSLMWFLKLTGAVSFSQVPVGGGGEGDVLVPRRRKSLPEDITSSLSEGAVKVLTSNYLACLGLDLAADTDAVERAYHELTVRYHPDTYSEYDMAELQDLLESVQDRLAAAWRVLSDEGKRKAYLQYLVSRVDTGRVTPVNVDAEIALRRGEAALERRDYVTALRAFEQAVSLNSREPEYYSYLAWATYRGGEGTAQERARAAQKVLRRAMSLDSSLARPSVIWAIIDNDMGDETGARRRLLQVLDRHPQSRLAKAALLKVGR